MITTYFTRKLAAQRGEILNEIPKRKSTIEDFELENRLLREELLRNFCGVEDHNKKTRNLKPAPKKFGIQIKSSNPKDSFLKTKNAKSIMKPKNKSHEERMRLAKERYDRYEAEFKVDTNPSFPIVKPRIYRK